MLPTFVPSSLLAQWPAETAAAIAGAPAAGPSVPLTPLSIPPPAPPLLVPEPTPAKDWLEPRQEVVPLHRRGRAFTVNAGQSIVGAKLWGSPPDRLLLVTGYELYTYNLPTPRTPFIAAPVSVESLEGRVGAAIFSCSGRFLVTRPVRGLRLEESRLYECSSVGLVPEVFPVFQEATRRPLAITDCGDWLLSKRAVNNLCLFSRVMGAWRAAFELPDEGVDVQSCQFTWNSRTLLVQYKNGTASLFSRDAGNDTWSSWARFEGHFESVLLTQPTRVFSLVSAGKPYFQAIIRTACEDREASRQDSSASWQVAITGPAVREEQLWPSADAQSFARVLVVPNIKTGRDVHLLKVNYFHGTSPHLMEITDAWSSRDMPWSIQWPDISSPLLAYRQGSTEARLVDFSE